MVNGVSGHPALQGAQDSDPLDDPLQIVVSATDKIRQPLRSSVS